MYKEVIPVCIESTDRDFIFFLVFTHTIVGKGGSVCRGVKYVALLTLPHTFPFPFHFLSSH